MTKIHHLKTESVYFEPVADLRKLFEIRRNDRNFREGDILVLEEWNAEKKAYTGRVILGKVEYLLCDFEGLAEGYVAMSIKIYYWDGEA